MAVRPLLAAAILALAAAVSQALEPEPEPAAQGALHVKTGVNDYRRPRNFGDTVVTMHASVQTASFAAVWFEYRTGSGRLDRLEPYVHRTAPIVVAPGAHKPTQRSRAVAVTRRFSYRAVARTLGSTAHGNWRYTLNQAVKAPTPPLLLPEPPKRTTQAARRTEHE